ncbi:MAG TPA: MMPL family transporter [Nitrospiria bacterium]|jgi:hypothetical protein
MKLNNSTNNGQAFPERLGRLVVQYRWWMVALPILLSLGVILTGLPKAGFNSSYRVFFSKDNPQLNAFDDFQAIYTKDDNITVVIHHPQKPVFSNEVLETVQDLTAGLWKTNYVTRVDSITNFQHTEVFEDELKVDDLVPQLPLSKGDLKIKEAIALEEPLLKGFLLSHDGRVTQINARVLFPPLEENPNIASVIYSLVEELVYLEREKHPEIDYRLNGVVATNTAFSRTPEAEMKKMMPIMLGLVIIGLIVLVRSTAGVVFPLLIVFLSIIFTAAISGHFGILLTPVSAAFPQILLSVAIAYSIHVVVSYARLRRNGLTQEEAVQGALQKNFFPIFLTALTTAIGFLSMVLNEVPPVRHLGILVGSGVLFTFVISVTLLPALLTICPCGIKPLKKSHNTEGGEVTPREWTDWLGDLVTRRYQFFYFFFLGVAVVGSLFIFRLELDNNPINYFKKGTWYRETAEFVDANLTGVSYTDYSIESGQPNGVSDPAFLAKVEAFSEYLMTFPEVVHVNTIVPIMKRLNKNLHGDNPAFYRLPETQELSAQYLLLYTLSLPFGLDLTNQINVDYSSTRVTATMKKTPGKRHREILSDVASWMGTHYPEIEAQGTGAWVMFTFLSDRVIRGMLMSLFVALLLITLVCIFTFKSIRLGLLSLVPNGLPIVLTFGVWGMLGDHVDFAVSIVATAALGIIVDDTIHLLVRYQRNKENGLESGPAFQHALGDVGHALLFTSIILTIGFGLFMLSGFRINSSLGAMISFSIVLALIYDFFFLPALLMKFDQKKVKIARPNF